MTQFDRFLFFRRIIPEIKVPSLFMKVSLCENFNESFSENFIGNLISFMRCHIIWQYFISSYRFLQVQ
jgi:hypothetical protein